MISMMCLLVLSVLPSASTDEWTKSFNLERAAKVRVETSDANIASILHHLSDPAIISFLGKSRYKDEHQIAS